MAKIPRDTGGSTKYRREPVSCSVYVTERHKKFLDNLADESSLTLAALLGSLIEREIRRVDVFKQRAKERVEKSNE